MIVGVQVSSSWRQRCLWLIAVAIAFLLHGAVVLFFWWQPNSQLVIPSAAAPVVLEVSMVAAPQTIPVSLPIGPEQQESSPSPRQRHEQIEVETDLDSSITPLIDIHSELMLKAPKENPQEKEKVQEQERVQEKKPTPIEDNVLPIEQQDDSSGDASGEEYVAESMAPLALQTQEAEVASAPVVGALSEFESEARLTWQNKVQAHLERRKRYPRRAKILGQQGAPWVKFTISRDGKVLNVALYRASGYDELDKEVVALVYRAEPLPPIPTDIPGEQLTLAVPVEFYRY